MSLFIWDESFSVHVSMFDQQHKHLINLVNELHNAMKKGSVKEVLEPLLNDLVRYTQEHFAEEERLMQETHYPGYLAHKQAHATFVDKVTEFQSHYKESKTKLSLDVMEFLVEWVKNHIKTVDHGYGPYLNERGIR